MFFLCLSPCDKLDIHFHPTNQCRKVFAAPSLLFENKFSGNVSMLSSPLFLRLFANQRPEPAPAKDPPSILLFHALLPTSSDGLFWPAAESFSSHLLVKHISNRCFCRLRISRCASMAISCPDHGSRTSLLLQVLSPASTSELLEFASSTLLFDRAAIFQSKLLLPNTGWPWWKALLPLPGQTLP